MEFETSHHDALGFFKQRGLIGVILVFLVLAGAYSIVIPLGEAADEVSHFAYVEYLVEKRRLPEPEGFVRGEAHQAPLYYVIAALATAWIPRDGLVVLANPDFVLNDPQTLNLLLHPRSEGFPYTGTVLAWHLVRLLSILCAGVTVWAAWKTADTFFPNDIVIALAAASFVAFLPSFLSLSAVVNNDNLIIMLASASFLVVAQISQRGLTLRRTVILGALLGLAVLAKLNAFALWVFVLASYLLIAARSRNWRAAARHGILCFSIALIITAPYLVYNLLTHGDPLAWSLYLKVAPLRQTPLTPMELLALAEPVLTSFWGRFGGALQLRMPDVVYLLLGAVALTALFGIVVALRQKSRYANVRRIVILTAILMLLLGAVYLRFVLADMGAGQARMLLPGIVPLGLTLAAGWFVLFRPFKGWALVIWSGGLLLLALSTLVLIQSSYTPMPLDATGAAASKAIDYGNTIRVLDYRVDRSEAPPGGKINVEFDWQALGAPQENYWFSLQLLGSEGAVANKDGVPSAGRTTTDWWQPGQIFRSHHALEIPPDVAPGTYSLMLGLHPYDRWDWLPVRGESITLLQEITVIPTAQ